MRLVLQLKSLKDVDFENYLPKHHIGFRAYFLDKLKGFSYQIHDSKQFNPFTFSNLFVVNKQIFKNSEYKVIFSTYSHELFNVVKESIKLNEKIFIGEAAFEVISLKQFSNKLHSFMFLDSYTPVIVTKNIDCKNLCLEYSDEYKELLRKNLVSKYNYFTQSEISENYDIFKNVTIKLKKIKPASLPLERNFDIKNRVRKVFGYYLTLSIGPINLVQKKILQTGYDVGFGTKNSYGFGFLNVNDKDITKISQGVSHVE